MVLAAWLEKRLERSREAHRAKILEEIREEARAAGRAEGRAVANREWQGWNERREAAEARGEPFTEPRPSARRRRYV